MLHHDYTILNLTGNQIKALFAQVIREARQRYALDIETEARHLGVSPRTILRWQAGQCLPRIRGVIMSCEFWGISANTLTLEPRLCMARKLAAIKFFGRGLAQKRQRCGLSRHALARAVGICPFELGRLEAGSAEAFDRMSNHAIISICQSISAGDTFTRFREIIQGKVSISVVL